MRPKVRNGSLSLSEEHYRIITNLAEGQFANRERYPSGFCTVKGRRGTALDKAVENRRRFYEYHLNAGENQALEYIIEYYLATKNERTYGIPKTWVPVE